MTDKEEDRFLVEQVLLEKNQSASAKLVRKYHDSLFRIVLDRLKVETEAEDLLQEIYTKAFNSLSSFNPRYAFSTWIFNIAEHACIDHLRKQGRYKENGRQTVPVQEENPHPDFPILQQEHEDEQENLSSLSKFPDPELLLNSLPEKYRPVFRLRYVEIMKYKDISKTTGLPIGTVKTYLFRAKAVLNEKKQNRERQDA